MMKWLKNNYHIIIVILISLTPILWFVGKGNILINGLDTNFPLDPTIWFKRRFFVWNDTINAGIDSSSSVSGTFFHLVQVIPYMLGFSLKNVELISMIFWFAAIPASAYFFANSLTDRKNKIACILFSIIYSYNIYLFNTWENVKVSNLSLVVGLPLFIGLSRNFVKQKWKLSKILVYSAIFAVVVSGAGINPSYLIAIIIGVLIYVAIEISFNIRNWKQIIFQGSTPVLVLLLVNIFWLLPLGRFLFISKGARSPEDIGFTNWVESLSKDTSLLNVIRLQGAWDWYTLGADLMPLYIPYAANYFYNPAFIIFSFSLPTIFLLSMIFRNKKENSRYIFMGVLFLVGVFLGSGLHEPTGNLYNILLKKLPYFSFFRSPWYIFTPYIVLAYASAAALTYEYFETKLKKAKIGKIRLSRLPLALVFVYIIGHMLYSYPLVTGKVFRPGRSDSFIVKFPDYLWETKDYLSKNQDKGRLLTYPDDQLEAFSWGYRGTESILSLFSDKEIIAPSFSFESPELGEILKSTYTHLKKGENQSAWSTVPFLGVDTIFVKNDSVSLSPKIDLQGPEISKKSIGEWTFYKNEKVDSSKIYAAGNFYEYTFGYEDLAKVLKYLDKNSLLVEKGDSEVEKINGYINNTNQIIKAEVSDNDLTSSTGKYSLDVSEPGNYTLAIEKNGLDANSIKISSQTINISNKVPEETDSSLIYKNLQVDAGFHEITVSYPLQENLMNSNNPIGNFELPKKEYVELPVESSTFVLYNSSEEERKVQFLAKDFNPFYRYLFTSETKHFYGDAPRIEIIQSHPTTPLKVFPISINHDADWMINSMVIEPVEIESKLESTFYIPPEHNSEASKTFLKDLSLTRIYDNNMYLIGSKTSDILLPHVKTTKISSTEYNVEISGIKNDYTLVFLENYSSDWDLKSDDNIGTPAHFKVEGYSNGWYIPGNSEKQNITIYYKGQSYYVLGRLVALIVFALCIFSPFILRNYERNK